MTRLTAKDFPQQLLEYYDYYAHGKISKREFLQLAGKYTVGGMTALALFNLLKPDYALAEQVAFTDPDIRPEYIHYPSPDGHGEVRAYQVMPAKIADKAPAVVVVHENRGLNPYIEDVARRVAKAGYIALAPDGLSSVGGYPGNDDEGRALQQKVDPVKLMNDFFLRRSRLWRSIRRRRGRSVSPVFATAAASATRRRWLSLSWPARCRFTAASRH
ncbi:putative enzyme [Klebsiella grimontii]|uniref:Putative enzyme n=1 Tax=Klebsiella grimontii TaxID=2058152 RepID=A0A7H4NWL3_9ENTR|nr:putative enzyme [Klebsiella grimontii]